MSEKDKIEEDKIEEILEIIHEIKDQVDGIGDQVDGIGDKINIFCCVFTIGILLFIFL